MNKTSMELIEQLNAALTRIATHVGATCCGIHTTIAIIAKIDELIEDRDFLKKALDSAIEQSDYFENERDKLQKELSNK
jgi:hypothetical protein